MPKTVFVDGAEYISDGLIEFVASDEAVFGLEVYKIIASDCADGVHSVVLEVGMRDITHSFGVRSTVRTYAVKIVSSIHNRTA